jgi:threonine/homoserine/homoserine lactone efflux protein
VEKLLLLFGLTCAISYVGSINPGPVNLAVIRTVLQGHRLAAIGIGVGCALPEVLGGYVAIRGLAFFQEYPHVFSTIKLLIAPILILIGFLSLRKKSGTDATAAPGQHSLRGGFLKGTLLALLNPALIPFWLIVLVWYSDRPVLQIISGADQVAFLLGAAVGALLIRLTYVALTQRYCDRILTMLHPRLLDQAFGWCFIGLGSWQAVQWWMETQA